MQQLQETYSVCGGARGIVALRKMLYSDVGDVDDSQSCASDVSLEQGLLAKPHTEQHRMSHLTLAGLTLLVGTGVLQYGFHAAYTSANESAIIHAAAISKQDYGVFVAMLTLGAMFGSLIAAAAAEILGRKQALLLASVPALLGLFLMLLFDAVPVFSLLVSGRFFVGIGTGMFSALVPLYISEVSPDHLRGFFGSFTQLLLTGGVLLANILGLWNLRTSNAWFYILLVSCFVLGTLTVALTFIPESPKWMLLKGESELVRMTLKLIRPRYWDVDNEIASFRSENRSSTSISEVKAYLSSWRVVWLIIVSVLIQVFKQGTGVSVIIAYSTEILKRDSMSMNYRDALIASVFVSVINLVSNMVALLFVDKLRRKTILTTSMSLMLISLIALSFLPMISGECNCSHAEAVLISFYIAFFSLGIGPVSWLICPELLPLPVRAIGLSLSVLANWAFAFLTSLTFDWITSRYSNQGFFVIYAGFTFVGLLFVIFCVPETGMGKSLESLEEDLLGPETRQGIRHSFEKQTLIVTS